MKGVSYFFKLKFYLGTLSAFRVFWCQCITKGAIRVSFISHPFKIRSDDFADGQIFNEVILKRSYQGVADKQKTHRIIDLGSNIGLSVISFLSEYPNAELVAVEPDVDNFKLLKENTRPYNVHKKRVHYFNNAVYDREAELYIEDPQVGTHGFRVAEEPGTRQKGRVRSITVNNLLDRLGWNGVDIIKIDIEGAERELFKNNTGWIGRTRYLIVETHDRFKEDCTKAVFQALEKYSYTMRVWNQNMLFSFKKSKEYL